MNYKENPISLGKAGKKYGIPVPTLHYWVKKGQLKVLKRPERHGQALLVDEASVVLAMQKVTKYTKSIPIYPFFPAPGYPQITREVPEFGTRDLIDKFLSSKRMSPHTIRWYQDSLYPFAKEYPIYPLEPEPFRKHLFNLEDKINPRSPTKKLSPRRQLNIWRALKTLCIWVHREYELPEYFSREARRKVDPPTRATSQKKLPRTLTDEEVIKLFKAADTFLDKLIIKLLGSTGIRAGELCSLTRDKISPTHIMVNGKTGENHIPIMPDLYDDLMLLASQVNNGKPIFCNIKGEPMDSDGVYQRVAKCMKRAGISGQKLGAHTLRHTFGRIMQRESGDLIALKHLLGHTQVSTTEIYATLSDKEVEEKYQQYAPHQLFNNKEQNNESAQSE